ncbi:MAG: NAD(P)H-hydrate epimerase, partial [Herbinix sp.]|nr:NAD(P)H-hydrate epimerase [Herbinix sp.]
MKYAVNSREMKLIDDYTIKVLKIPEAVLMERAAIAVTDIMKRQIKKEDRILAVCGPGNNGGDGIAAGRILYLQGYHVAILLIGDENKATAGMRAQMEIAKNLGITIENCNKLHEYNIIIDAIFGVGLSRPVTGAYEEIINEINSRVCTVYSVDIPSGISADNGKVMNTAIHADYTITFGHQKKGLLFYPGADYSGNISIADIGFPNIATTKANPDTIYYDWEDLCKLPTRKNYSNKGTFGKVLLIAGSQGMSGAAYLSAKAAYRSGAGLVKVLTSKDNRVILQTSIPEAIIAAYDEETSETADWNNKILAELAWANVIVIGPGIGLSQTAQNLIEMVIKYAKVPVIIDADGITLLSRLMNNHLHITNILPSENQSIQNESRNDLAISTQVIQSRLNYLASLRNEELIITPHLMELSRLIGVPISEIVNNLVDTACQCSYNNNLIYAIKDARTIVTQSERKYINVSGNNGMATGGSG